MSCLDDLFDEKIQSFLYHIHDHHYLIEMTKFCGYSEMIMISKNATLLDLYKIVSQQFMCNTIQCIYNENVVVPLSDHISIREFIICHNMIPIYSSSKPIVYRFFINDGHNHSHV